jgi:hypothetical protein
MQLDTVFTEGALVDIDISTGSFERRLQPEDLGLDPQKLSKAFKLGSKSLMPIEIISEFKHHDYKARSLLTQMSFSFPFGGARFIPKKTLVDFAERIESIIVAFNKSVTKLVDNYEKYKLQMRKHYVEAANEAYDRLTQMHGLQADKTEFINGFLERVDKFYPNVSDIPKKFNMDYQVFQVALPDLSQASYEDMATESQKVKMLEDAYRTKIYRKINEFVNSLVSELRSKAEKVLKCVEAGFDNNRKYTEATHRMLKDMIENYGSLNIVNDKGFQDELESYKTRFLGNDAKTIRGNPDLRKQMLEALKSLTKRVLDQSEIQQLAEAYRTKIKV